MRSFSNNELMINEDQAHISAESLENEYKENDP